MGGRNAKKHFVPLFYGKMEKKVGENVCNVKDYA